MKKYQSRQRPLKLDPPQLPLVALALLMALMTSPGVVLAESDWPQWRGPDRDGVSSETGLAASWPEQGPKIAWRIDGIGEGFSSVATTGDSLYTQGTIDDKSTVFALSNTTGEQKWATQLGTRLVQDKGNGPRGTPSIVGDHLYVLTGKGLLAKLNRADGEIVWQADLLDRYGAKNIYWGFSESPLVVGDRVYAMPGGAKATVVALDAKTGEHVWGKDYGHPASYSSLVPATIAGIPTLLGFTQKAGIGIRMSDGELLWEYAAPANRTANAATPVTDQDIVVYSSGYGTGSGAIKVTKDGDSVKTEELWFQPRLQNHHGGIVLYEGHLYGFFGNALACADLLTGELKWQARSVGKGSLTVADGKLYLLGERHRVGLAKATPDGYEPGGTFDLEKISEPAWAYPVVSDGKLYIRDQNTLTAYQITG